MEAHQTPPSLGFSRQEHWSGLPFPSPCMKVKSEREVAQSCPTLSDPMDYRLLCPWDFPGKSTGVGCHCLLWYMYIKLYINIYKPGIEEAAYSSSLLCSFPLPFLPSLPPSLCLLSKHILSILPWSTQVFIFYASSISFQTFSFYEALNPLTHTIDIS